MEKLIIFSPLITFIIGYNAGINFSRIFAVLFSVCAAIFYTSHLVVIVTLLTLCLAEFFLEKFHRNMNSLRRIFNNKLRNLVDELSSLKKDSDTTKLALVSNEKVIKNILHIYELSKDIAAYIDLEKMFSLIVDSLNQQFIIKDVAMKIFDGNTIFRKGIFFDINETIKIPKILENMIHLPLNIGDKYFGVISAKIPPLFEKDAKFVNEISAFVEELNPAIQRAILYLKLEEMSRTDGLTGLYRRGYFNQRLKEEELLAKRSNGRFSILMMDIDHFKKVNDTYGHQAGDMVIKTVSEILKNSIYETDFAARYGGEEFVVIFPKTDPDGLKIKSEKIRQKIQDSEITIGLEKIKVTASFGIAHYPKDSQLAEEVLHKADISLYKSKQTGRNKVTEFK
ncbi:MAG: GGDEF domain-containing protein [Elusimicrobia bacterium]|nr:GGDEF domain-containing protein [Elusimicrobiota bacterium]